MEYLEFFILLTTLSCSLTHAQETVCNVAPPCRCSHRYVDGVYGQYLDCSRKRLTDVPQFPPGNMVLRLDLEGNRITSISSNAFINVSTWEILIDNNRLGEISPGAFTGLETTLRSITLKRNTDLRLINNSQFQNMTRLRKMDLSQTNIRKAPFAPFLEELDVSRNNMARLDDFFPEYHNLFVLNLGYNELTTFPNASLSVLRSSLAELDLSSNRIRSIPKGTLEGYNKLKVLNLSSNKRFEQIPTEALKDVPQLENLNMYYNNIHNISNDAFDPVPNLKIVSLGFNPIRTIPSAALRPLTQLESFSVWNISMISISEDAFANIKSPNMGHINIGSNLLKTLPEILFASVGTLYSLHINSNYLSSLPDDLFNSIPRLQYLRLENNKFQETPKTLRYLRKLTSLYLDHNILHEFTGNELADDSKLRSLQLHDNLISNFPTNLFLKARQLSSVDLSRNNISNIDSCVLTTIQPKLKISRLYLESNPLHCDCHVLFVRKYRGDIRLSSSGRGAICETPEELKGRSVTSLSESEYNCTSSLQTLCPSNTATKRHNYTFIISVVVPIMFGGQI